MKMRLAVLALFVAVTARAQVDPMRNISGTSANPGAVPWVTSGSGGWTFFHGFSAHVTNVSESGPAEQRSETFSTNWLGAGLRRDFGSRMFLLARGRVSLEPYTIPDDDGYPQMLQYVPTDAGGPLVDRMRAHDLIGEAALQLGFRPTDSTLLHVYAAAVGDPALGAPPAELRASGVDFAEAPFAYDIQESFHDSTRVVTAGFTTRWIGVEGSVFHDAVTFGDHTEIDDGDIDSNSVRVTLTPSEHFSAQVSRGKLREVDERDITTASVSYSGDLTAATALWTRRETELGLPETAYSFELALRASRNTFMARAEWVDRPGGFPDVVSGNALEQTTHITAGYIFDFLHSQTFRGGIGVNIDYHTQSHELPERYGHKPQAIYAFVRLRSGRF
ncbi:MAG TPA: hypothetical protein VF824_05760 [Thermoanaerobaculia bacterium]|jgi:hypothetical protein